MTGTPFLQAYYKRFSQLFIDESTKLISLYTKHTLPSETQHNSLPNTIHDTLRICLPICMFKTVFNILQDHSHTGLKITSTTFSKYYYITYLDKCLSIFIHDCLECQSNKHFKIRIQTALKQFFSKHPPSFSYRIPMDTKDK